MPVDCHHGRTIDWGDFGPCQNCAEHDWSDDCPNFEPCDLCAVEQAQGRAEAAAAFVQALHEQLDNDVRVQKWAGETRGLSEWERDDIVASVLKVLAEREASS